MSNITAVEFVTYVYVTGRKATEKLVREKSERYGHILGVSERMS